MRKNLGDRLPVFTRDEIALLNGSMDFVGVNHYSSRFVSDGHDSQSPLNIYPYCDRQVQSSGCILSFSTPLFLKQCCSA
jgi:beta-glucosidase